MKFESAILKIIENNGEIKSNKKGHKTRRRIMSRIFEVNIAALIARPIYKRFTEPWRSAKTVGCMRYCEAFSAGVKYFFQNLQA